MEKFEAGKTYPMRDGRFVRIIVVVDGLLVGFVDDYDRPLTWHADSGRANKNFTGDFDLMPPAPGKRVYRRWVNACADWEATFSSEASAIKNRGADCIATFMIEREYTEGEGL